MPTPSRRFRVPPCARRFGAVERAYQWAHCAAQQFVPGGTLDYPGIHCRNSSATNAATAGENVVQDPIVSVGGRAEMCQSGLDTSPLVLEDKAELAQWLPRRSCP